MRNRMAVLTGITILSCSAFGFAAMTDADVLNDLHQANQSEIHMGQLAEQKGTSSDVVAYGKTLASDHQDNDKRVVDLATKEGIALKAPAPGIMDQMTMKN